MEIFSALLVRCAGIHQSPVNSPHRGQWRGALMFSLIYARTNGWVNNRDADDFRHHRVHYDITLMKHWNTMTFFLYLWFHISGAKTFLLKVCWPCFEYRHFSMCIFTFCKDFDERMFLWKCWSFWDRKCLDLRGTRTPSLRIHAECSNHLSYQGQTFIIPCFWMLALVVISLNKVNIGNVNWTNYTCKPIPQLIFLSKITPSWQFLFTFLCPHRMVQPLMAKDHLTAVFF